MNKAPQPQAGIEKLHLYTPGKSKKGANVRKLSSNENLYGPSPLAIDAVKAASANLWLYPSVDHLSLREAITEVHDLDVSKIICGAGSDEILALLGQAYAGAGDEVIMTAHGFEIYGIVAHSVGADLVTVGEVDRVVSVDQILAGVTERTKLIYIANPGNPTGTLLETKEVERLARALPSDVLLVLDGAYAEFASDFDGGAHLAGSLPNVFMTRTFSKLYGLGGLRIGWGYGSQAIIDTLNKMRGPFNLSSAALAGAEAAMRDQEYACAKRDQIVADREDLAGALRQQGWGVDVSAANFLLVRFADEAQAKRAYDALADRGLMTRMVGHYDLPEALRITIGTQDDCAQVKACLHDFMELENA